MSALPPKADIARRHWHVRLVPKADIRIAAKLSYSITRRRGRAARGALMISSNLLACTTAGPQCLPSRAPERRGFLRIALRSEAEAASLGKQGAIFN
jgi:hypothetical protein